MGKSKGSSMKKRVYKKGQPSRRESGYRTITIPQESYDKLLRLSKSKGKSMSSLASKAISSLR